MNYEERKQARIDRLHRKAEKARERSEQLQEHSHNLVKNIPFGQPILVGHHSERGHRRTLERSQNAMFKSLDEHNKAKEYERRAEAAENNNAIFSDDPEAVEKLKTKLTDLEKQRDRMKEVNAAWRSYAKKQDKTKLQKLGYDDEQINRMAETIKNDYSWNKQPFPSWQLSNLGATIRNTAQRLKRLETQQNAEHKETVVGEIKVVENVEQNRIQIIFPDKPDEQTRRTLKRHGFRWSRYNMAWQRHLNNAGRYAVSAVIPEYKF